jgi:hypothetical protein
VCGTNNPTPSAWFFRSCDWTVAWIAKDHHHHQKTRRQTTSRQLSTNRSPTALYPTANAVIYRSSCPPHLSSGELPSSTAAGQPASVPPSSGPSSSALLVPLPCPLCLRSDTTLAMLMRPRFLLPTLVRFPPGWVTWYTTNLQCSSHWSQETAHRLRRLRERIKEGNITARNDRKEEASTQYCTNYGVQKQRYSGEGGIS